MNDNFSMTKMGRDAILHNVKNISMEDIRVPGDQGFLILALLHGEDGQRRTLVLEGSRGEVGFTQMNNDPNEHFLRGDLYSNQPTLFGLSVEGTPRVVIADEDPSDQLEDLLIKEGFAGKDAKPSKSRYVTGTVATIKAKEYLEEDDEGEVAYDGEYENIYVNASKMDDGDWRSLTDSREWSEFQVTVETVLFSPDPEVQMGVVNTIPPYFDNGGDAFAYLQADPRRRLVDPSKHLWRVTDEGEAMYSIHPKMTQLPRGWVRIPGVTKTKVIVMDHMKVARLDSEPGTDGLARDEDIIN